MQPTGQQLHHLQDVLLSVYPSLDDLRMLARQHLDIRLAAVVPIAGRTQTEMIFDLVEHYAAEMAVCIG